MSKLTPLSTLTPPVVTLRGKYATATIHAPVWHGDTKSYPVTWGGDTSPTNLHRFAQFLGLNGPASEAVRVARESLAYNDLQGDRIAKATGAA